ncbi:hypothetical protein HX810_09835 [Pseudomonas salomonii]|uniref:Uncharacterized protein n=1 Tax=Pseudomonas salomonii TaxID=191391 RepID=A0A7Y8GBW3_9PSED|nr:hypothetical protein [Pseudomonas salomonii]NWF07963.1 hypothetical protein [Pseudomonas salomonii]
MNEAQTELVENTLRIVGWLALVLGLLILVVGFSNNLDLEDIFDTEKAAFIVWSPFVIGVASLWIRAFMRAGRRRV